MPKNHKLDRKRVDWGFVGVCSGLILFLIGLCAQSLRQAQHALLLQKAVEAGNFVKANALLERGGYQEEDIQEAFFTAVMRGSTETDYELTRLFLKHHADPNRKQYGATPLSRAVQSGNGKYVRLLLDYGAKPNELAFGQTLIERAMITNSTNIARLLLERGAQYTANGKQGIPLLHECIMKKDVRCAKALLDHGVNPNQKFDKDTLLSNAIEWKAPVVARELILHGANVNRLDSGHRTPLGQARKHANKDLIALLKAHGAKE